MPRPKVSLNRANIVGSFAHPETISGTTATTAGSASDVLEIRLDLIVSAGISPSPSLWAHLRELPILFTARRKSEGSPIDLDAEERSALLRGVLEDAALIDIEVASLGEMSGIVKEIQAAGVPLVASYHDFGSLPAADLLEMAARSAKESGAAVFKAAARLHSPDDIAALANFQSADHGISVATMGMGPLAPVSRLLCAQSGSVLNYGFIGNRSTAPGQWSAAFLKEAVDSLPPAGT